MATNQVHPLLKRAPDIEAMVPYWDLTDTIVEGHEAIRKAGVDYLPKFPDEPKDEYDFRLALSKFTNIYRDVLEGLATKPFQEEITLIKTEQGEIPDFVNEFVENVDGAGNNLTMFSALTFFNGINSAIDWIFVDYPTVAPGTVVSQAEAKQKNIKPFWTHVLGRNVYEIRTTMIGSKEHLSYFRVFEPANGKRVNDNVRVFELTQDGKVQWTLYEKNPKAEKVEDQMVRIDGGFLSISEIPFVPFATGRRDGRTFKFYPVMRDAADLQVTLYRNESALEFIKTMAGYPMLAANGMKPELDAGGKPKKVAIGPMRVLYGVPDGAGGHGEWRFIEPSANSMEFLQKNIDKTKQDLRELGRQPLTALSTQLTTTTTSIAAGKARSAVTAWALGLKDSLENALRLTMLYMSSTFEPEVNVYTGFDNVLDDGSDLDALDKARARGDISHETFLSELKRRKVLSPEFNFADEQKRILNDVPVDDTLTDDAPDNESDDDAQTS